MDIRPCWNMEAQIWGLGSNLHPVHVIYGFAALIRIGWSYLKCSCYGLGKFRFGMYQKYINIYSYIYIYPRYTKIYHDIQNTKRRRGHSARPGPGAGPEKLESSREFLRSREPAPRGPLFFSKIVVADHFLSVMCMSGLEQVICQKFVPFFGPCGSYERKCIC